MTAQPRVVILEKQGGVLSWHRDLEAGFRALGAEVFSLQMRPASWAEYRAKWKTRVPALENPAVIARVAAALRQARPDLVVLLKQPGLPPPALAAWRDAAPRAPFVGWLCDHLPAWPVKLEPGLDGLYHFDSATRPLLDQIHAGRSTRLAHLPLAADPARYAAAARPFDQRRRALVFAGTNTPERRRFLDSVRVAGARVDTYGPLARCGWRLWRRRHLKAGALARLYSDYFATINLLQAPNTVHGLNLRAFEIAAAGGLGTYPLVPDLAAAFVPGEEIVAYRDHLDLKAQFETLLAQPEKAAGIAAAGRARVLREHTFLHRAARFRDDWLT